MTFAEKYSFSVNSSNLKDDELNSRTEALKASAFASVGLEGNLGALLTRVKYADGIPHKGFEGNPDNLLQLLRNWLGEVTKKGLERGWQPIPKTEWDMAANKSFYRKVAEMSLSHWLDDRCLTCAGTGVQITQHVCPACKGSKIQPIIGGRLIVERVQEMTGELEGIFQSHNSRAASILWRK